MTEKELIEKGYRKYQGKEIDVYFNTNVCIHSGVCVKGLKSVFDTKKRPWINLEGANQAEVKKIVNSCPSGALKYVQKLQD